MTSSPKISIITPTYNSEASISPCILSVANQNYLNKEHLIIDGQSNDNTLEIIKKYATRYRHIKLISEKDEGIYDAMNKGIELSTGDWIYFLGSDDIFYKDSVLENIFNNDLSKLDIIYGNVQWGDTEQIYDGPFSRFKLLEKNICHQAIFFKRNVFTKIGKFQIEYDVLADWVFNMKWFNDENIKRKYVDHVIAKYNVAGHSSQRVDKIFLKNQMDLVKTHFPEEYFEIFRKTSNLREIINTKNQELIQKDQIINTKNQELIQKDQIIRGKEQELFLIKSSKFWKLRNACIKIKNCVSI